jgi:hypothetical protein
MGYPPKKLLAKDSTKQLFIKYSNLSDNITSELRKAIIRNEMIGEGPFSTTSAVSFFIPQVKGSERPKMKEIVS